MTIWTLGQLAHAAGGTCLGDSSIPIAAVSTDTRMPLTGHLFVALSGPRFDGHDHLAGAKDGGAVAAMVRCGTRAVDGLSLIAVDDPLAALGILASWWRRQLTDTRVIAITGTAGKTTTKDLLAGICQTCMRTVASPRSFNNDIGVPLTILSARKDDEVLIAEVGINEVGEMAPLADMVQPDAVIVTLVGHGHLAGLDTLATVATEKYRLVQSVQRGGHAWVLRQDIPLPVCDASIHTFGEDPMADLVLEQWGPNWFHYDQRRWPLGLLGRAASLDALAAVAAARWLGVTDACIEAGLSAATPSSQRMQLRSSHGVEIIDDTWNANPDSMASSLETFANMPSTGTRWLVLGDMLELGGDAHRQHRLLAATLIGLRDDHRLDQVVLIGTEMVALVEALADSSCGPIVSHLVTLSDDEAVELAGRFGLGDLVLVKGSRGLKLERVIDAMDFQEVGPRQPMNQD